MDEKLNKEQLEAVNLTEGNLLIIASAGTGKTTTIVERYVNLIKNHKYHPDEILMTTFTNKAAKEMVRKIVERTDQEPPYVGTMHSLFLKILRAHAGLVIPSENFTIIDDSDKKKILKSIMLRESIDLKSDNLKYFLMWISKFKNRAILAENLSSDSSLDYLKEQGVIEDILEDEIIRIDPGLRKYVNKVYKNYEEHLRKNNQIDLDDILLLTLKLFQNNKEIKDFYSNKFKAIMVDEAQDLNIVQIRILNLLSRNNLCLIGDDCQNIYEWRGSSNELVFDFNETQNKVFLKENYRSGKKIISAVNKVIDSMSFKIDKQLNCTKEHNGEILIQEFYNFDEEAEFIVDKIKELLHQGIKKGEIAVLFRTNRIGKILERELRRNKIPCYLSRSKDFFEREEIKDLLSFLKLKVNPYSAIDFERLLTLIEGIGAIKAKKFIELAKKHNCSYLESLDFIGELNLNAVSIKELVNFKDVMNSPNKTSLDNFLNNLGYLNYLTNKYHDEAEKLVDKLENIKVIDELFGKDNNIEQIKVFLDSLIELEKREKTTDKITLSTIHGAKGLEWEYVFLASCNEKTLPFYIFDLENVKRDSELRLFYVAISRAKKALFISHYGKSEWGKEIERSQFIDILEEKGYSTI